MKVQKLDGCLVLIVDPQSLLLMDMQKIFEDEGARVVTANGHDEALTLADSPDLNAAVIDFSLAANNGGAICNRLTELGVPFVFCSARNLDTNSLPPNVPFVSKPVYPQSLVDAVASMVVADARTTVLGS